MVKRNDVRGRGKKRKKKEKKRRRVTGGKNGVLEKGAKPTVFFVAGEGIFAFCAEDLSHFFTFFFYPSTLSLSPPSAKQEEDASSSSSSSSFLSFSFLPPFFSRNTNDH